MPTRYKVIIPIFLLLLTSISSAHAQTLTGDANGDGVVNGQDYVRWNNNYNTPTTEGASKGDFDLNGFVDGRDYVKWLNNYQTTAQVAYHRTTPWTVPGRVQAEDFDTNGEGQAYHDTTPTNTGTSTYRTEGVDLMDYSGTVAVGQTAAGEWLEYTFDNPTAGNYTLTVNSSTIYAGKTITATWNDNSLGTITLPQTATWDVYQTASIGVTLPQGYGVLRLTFNSDFQNFDWVELTSNTATPTPTSAPVTYPRELVSNNSAVRFIETKAPEGNKIFVKAELTDPAITSEIRLDWSVDNRVTYTKEYYDPYFIGSDNSGVPNGYTMPSNSMTFKVVFYYDNYNSNQWAEFTYTLGGTATATPSASTNPTPTTTPTTAPTTAPTGTPTAPGDKLTWAPPAMTNPVTLNLTTSSNGTQNLSPNTDYIVKLPSPAFPKALYLVGGRNIQIIGGVISVDSDSSSTENAALRIYDATGTVHIEGVKLQGAYITDGIHTRAPQATVQVQNVFVNNMWQKGDPDNGGSHGDCIQTWGGVTELRVDKFTCISSPYQGLQLHADYNPPMYRMTFKRTDLHGNSASRYLFWVTPGSWATGSTLDLDNVWVDNSRSIAYEVCIYSGGCSKTYEVTGTENGVTYASWPNLPKPVITGKVYKGTPPIGNFVSPSSVGLNYTSPGYK